MKWKASDVDRLWRHYCVTLKGCWEWTASIDAYGYGRFWFRDDDGKSVFLSASRFAYIVHNNHVPPDGITVDHKCKNRCCINPSHLRLLTLVDNVRDGNHYQRSKTHCKRGHEFSSANTKILRSGGRLCLACNDLRNEQRRVCR